MNTRKITRYSMAPALLVIDTDGFSMRWCSNLGCWPYDVLTSLFNINAYFTWLTRDKLYFYLKLDKVHYMIAKESKHYLLTKMLQSSTTRSPDKTAFSMSLATAAKFFFLCSRLKGCALSLITRPVELGLYSLHSSTDLTKTMLCIRNSSKVVPVCSGFVIIFRQKSTVAGSTVW